VTHNFFLKIFPFWAAVDEAIKKNSVPQDAEVSEIFTDEKGKVYEPTFGKTILKTYK